VAPIYEEAMPVILRNEQEIETWLNAPWTEAKVLQRSLPDDELIILDEPRQQPEPAAATQGFLL
jgi:putative SOS response-associated peptidase YedK